MSKLIPDINIPTIDISDIKEWQTVVDREDGLYIGHPTTVLLSDGKTIITVYPKCHGYGQIVLKKSFDGGKTWSKRLPVPQSFSTSLEVPTIFKTFDKDGNERLIMFSGLYPIRMSVSYDNGETFSELKPIGDFGGVTAMGDIAELSPGEYIAVFHDDGRFIKGGTHEKIEVFGSGEGENAYSDFVHTYSDDGGKTWGEPQAHWIKSEINKGAKRKKLYEAYAGKPYSDGRFYVYAVKSRDGGVTWGEPEIVCAPTPDMQLCEPAIVRSPDKKRLIMLLRENTHKKNSFMLISDDNAKTWSEPTELCGALTGDRHCARYLKDGRLFISFRDTCRNSPTWGDWVAWVGTFDDIVNGKEGQYRLRIMKNYYNGDCAYPGIEILPDGTVVTTTYGHFDNCADEEKRKNEAYVVSVRFKIEDAEKRGTIL